MEQTCSLSVLIVVDGRKVENHRKAQDVGLISKNVQHDAGFAHAERMYSS